MPFLSLIAVAILPGVSVPASAQEGAKNPRTFVTNVLATISKSIARSTNRRILYQFEKQNRGESSAPQRNCTRTGRAQKSRADFTFAHQFSCSPSGSARVSGSVTIRRDPAIAYASTTIRFDSCADLVGSLKYTTVAQMKGSGVASSSAAKGSLNLLCDRGLPGKLISDIRFDYIFGAVPNARLSYLSGTFKAFCKNISKPIFRCDWDRILALDADAIVKGCDGKGFLP